MSETADTPEEIKEEPVSVHTITITLKRFKDRNDMRFNTDGLHAFEVLGLLDLYRNKVVQFGLNDIKETEELLEPLTEKVVKEALNPVPPEGREYHKTK